MPLVHVGWPEMFALVAINGCDNRSINAIATFERDCLIARRPVFPVTLSGTRDEAGAMMVSGPGQNFRAKR